VRALSPSLWLPLTTVRGKRRKDTVLICLSQDDIEEGKIAMNKGTSGLFTLDAEIDLQWQEATALSNSPILFTSRPRMTSNTVKGGY